MNDRCETYIGENPLTPISLSYQVIRQLHVPELANQARGIKGTVSRVFCFWFFHESSSQPQSISLGPFQIFLKIRGDIRKSRCTTGINDTGGKFATVSMTLQQILPPVLLVLLIPLSNNGNNIRMLRL